MATPSGPMETAKAMATGPLPTPAPMSRPEASPQGLLERLNWGEPALTIIDIRERQAFNQERITGAIPMPPGQLPEAAQPLLEANRDIYLYGDSPESTSQVADQLRQAGFQRVAELRGGLSGWKAIGGPTEGTAASR